MTTIHNIYHSSISNSLHHHSLKKKYSKVNDDLRIRFLELIVQNNKSIKEASFQLNINYSSAKAILAHHRKLRFNIHKNAFKGCKRAEFRMISDLQTGESSISEFICTTGGKQVKRWGETKHKGIHKTPIITQVIRRNFEYLDNTSNSSNESI